MLLRLADNCGRCAVPPFSLAVFGSNSDYFKGFFEVEKPYEGSKLEKTDNGNITSL